MQRNATEKLLLNKALEFRRLGVARVTKCGIFAMIITGICHALMFPTTSLTAFNDSFGPGTMFFYGFVFLTCLDEYRLWVESNSPLLAAVSSHDKELIR